MKKKNETNIYMFTIYWLVSLSVQVTYMFMYLKLLYWNFPLEKKQNKNNVIFREAWKLMSSLQVMYSQNSYSHLLMLTTYSFIFSWQCINTR